MMNIAVLTDDGKTISDQYPTARHYLVLTINDGVVTSQELRDKRICHGHDHDDHEHDDDHEHHDQQDITPYQMNERLLTLIRAGIPEHHAQMIAPIADCEVILARGFRKPIHADLQRSGIRPVLTSECDITQAALAYSAGRLDEYPGVSFE